MHAVAEGGWSTVTGPVAEPNVEGGVTLAPRARATVEWLHPTAVAPQATLRRFGEQPARRCREEGSSGGDVEGR